MSRVIRAIESGALVIVFTSLIACRPAINEVVRPEEIRSMRQVVYDGDTYKKLAAQWKAYDHEYPSEYSYANWMYATRYAGDPEYSELLEAGLKRYPANPTLLYLMGLEYAIRQNNVEGLRYLEQAAELDKRFIDPWFPLVVRYMDVGDEAKLDHALGQLLQSGAIPDIVMDFSYNMITALEDNAIVITNGDNDTYPGWILTRILKIRPDVTIVNISLLNAEWYPLYLIEQGLPQFIGPSELGDFRRKIMVELEGSDVWKNPSPSGPFGDPLIQRLVVSAERAGRPVYLAHAIARSPALDSLIIKGRNLGLAVLVTSPSEPYDSQLRTVSERWLTSFRYGGLDSWQLRRASASDAGKRLVTNYADAISDLLPQLQSTAPDQRHGLFRWYQSHIEHLLDQETRYKTAQAWGKYASDIKEISDWHKRQGVQ